MNFPQRRPSQSFFAALLGLFFLAGSAVAQSALLPDHSHSGASTGSRFGRQVASAGDVNGDGIPDYIIGASRALVAGVTKGNAQVYSGADSSLLYLFEGVDQDDEFGVAVGTAGDVDSDGYADIIVGANLADDNGPSSGTVYVYSGFDGSLIRTHKGASSSRLGSAVAGMGDLNGDGVDDYAIGAYNYYNTATTTYGRVLLRSGANGSSLGNYFAPVDTLYYGLDIANAGDLTGDGINEIMIGAYRGANPVGSDAGRAYVHDGSDMSLLYSYSGDSANDRFGSAVAGVGDTNGDGVPDFVIGAFLDDVGSGNNDRGRAFLYSGADGSMLFSFNGPSASDYFGTSASGVGDFNGDGFSDFVIGAPLGSARVRVFSGIDGSVLANLNYSPATAASHGHSVCGVGDLNGDGLGDVLVGAYAGDLAGSDFGDAHLYLAPAIGVRSYFSALGDHALSARWVPDGNLPAAATGTIVCDGASPGGLGVAYLSLASADLIFFGSLAIVVNPDPSLILEEAFYGYDLTGSITVPGIDRQNPFLAGYSIYLQLFESSPVISSSNGLAIDMIL